MRSFKKIRAIAIDGPAGSGKSTISRIVAEKLGYIYIDTGAMYRALTLKTMRSGADLSDEKGLIDISHRTDIKLLPPVGTDGPIRVMLDGEDVTEDVRSMEVTSNVKYVCKIPDIRRKLVESQREMAVDSSGAVMEGRDIGTVVLPDAMYKFYVDASFEERVSRRLAELKAKGCSVTSNEVAEDLKTRDHTDRTRETGPLKKAEDAIFIDTTYLSADQVVSRIVDHVERGA